MTAQHRAALRDLIVGDGETRIDSYEAADRILTWLEAGWMPRPEPGSAEWEAMVERAAKGMWNRADDEVGWDAMKSLNADTYMAGAMEWVKGDADAALRAALYPEEQSNG